MAVADSEDRHAHRQDRRIDARRVGLGDASRSAGNDEAADPGELVRVGIDRKDVALNTRLADTPREQVTILAAGV